MKKILGLFVVFLIGLLAISTVSALDLNDHVEIESVKIEGDVIEPDHTNRLDLERGQEIEVKVRLNSDVDLEDVEIEAFISGYEYSDHEEISDSAHVTDMEANVSYVKKLNIRLPENVEEDDYKLRMIISDRYSEQLTQNYNLKLDVPRHSLKIKDVVFSPENQVVAGRSLLAMARIENDGEKDEEGIKVRVAVPDLGISASDYIDELESDDSTTSEELYMRVPKCAEAGTYDVSITLEYDEGYETVAETFSIEVLESDLCDQLPQEDRTVITVGPEVQNIAAGDEEAVYPIAITNAGSESKTYTIQVNVGDWAQTRLSDNVLVLSEGATKVAYLYVSADRDTSAGEKLVNVKINSGSETLQEVSLRANIVEKAGFGDLKSGLEIALVVLVVILVILALVIGFSKLRENKGNEEEEDQTYY